jgi:hypothetical protein
MKLSHAMTLFGVGLSVTALAIVQGCSSSSSNPPPPGDGGNGTDAPAMNVGGPPPLPSGATPTSSTAEHNYALKTLFLGDTDTNGVASSNAWKAFGYNIDGKVTTTASTDVCTLQQGAPKSTQTDGMSGIDNSFGENILPILITTAGSDAASKINAAIVQGHFTVMIDVTGLDGTPMQTASGLKGFLLGGANFAALNDGGAPTFTTADNWPVLPSTVTDTTNARSAKIQFPNAYVVNGTFVNGTPGEVDLSLSIGGVFITLTIKQATITMNQSVTNSGIIAGVLNTEDLITQLQMVAGRISTSLCSGQAFQSIAAQIRQASDIMSDGTNNAGTTCDGISIGLGFNAVEIGKPMTVAPPPTPSPDPCADAGTSG